MSEQDGEEIVSESYRRRKRLMGWIASPFDAIEAVALAVGLVAAAIAAYSYLA